MPSDLKQGLTAEDVHVADAEPEIPCPQRCCVIPLAVVSLAPASAVVPILLAETPVELCCMCMFKITVCSYCCPHSVHNCFRNVLCTPCRLTRIVFTGKGHICCYGVHAWPWY
jgi:hypothetical protein